MTSTRRAPTSEEATELRRWLAPRRKALTETSNPGGHARIVVALLVGAVLIAIFTRANERVALRVGIVLWAGVMAVVGVAAVRRERKRTHHELASLDAEEASLLASVVVVTVEPTRIVATADAGEDYGTWWLVEEAGTGWLAFDDGMWAERQTFPAQARVTVVQSVTGQVLTITGQGDAVPIERRDLQAPDFVANAETRYWSPPEDAGPGLPIILATPPALIEPGRLQR